MLSDFFVQYSNYICCKLACSAHATKWFDPQMSSIRRALTNCPTILSSDNLLSYFHFENIGEMWWFEAKLQEAKLRGLLKSEMEFLFVVDKFIVV